MAFDEPNYGNSSRKSPGKPNYSPSASYNYNGGNYQHQSAQSPSSRRRPDRNNNGKRHSNNAQAERLVKQNDMIIRLLKEIRDRLPEPQQIAELMETRDSDMSDFSSQDEQFGDDE
ncbi:MAG: hypothetical protein ACLFSB_05880 [Chitinispirillaceae bacterium]